MDVVVGYAERVAKKAGAKFLTGGTPLFVRWFGLWDLEAGSEVKANLDTIADNAASYSGDCNQGTVVNTCITSGITAWTSVSASPTRIHLCSPWFVNPVYATGFVTKGSALTHEKSHLASSLIIDQEDEACGGDTCYGPVDARALAKSPNYTKARANADSYGLFVQDLFATTVITPSVLTVWL